jgi:hypothetical protein
MKGLLPGYKIRKYNGILDKTFPQDGKTNLEDHLMGLVAIPEREPGTKISFQVWDCLDSFH